MSKLSYKELQKKLIEKGKDEDKPSTKQKDLVAKISKLIILIFDKEFAQEMQNMIANGAKVGDRLVIEGTFPRLFMHVGIINEGIEELNMYGHELLYNTIKEYYHNELIRLKFKRHSFDNKYYYRYTALFGND